jgi:hypothetical protein
MGRRNPPMLMFGGLTKTVYVVTRYRHLGDGRYEAQEKFDVTDQFVNLARGDAASLLTAYGVSSPEEESL